MLRFGLDTEFVCLDVHPIEPAGITDDKHNSNDSDWISSGKAL